jgi:4'-phosphopantetheinyl transferase
VLVGIAPVAAGVDVEVVPSEESWRGVSELLHPDERDQIAAAPVPERGGLFARLWARKEAYLKGVGTGIAVGLESEYVGAGDRAASPAGWTVRDVPAPDGYAAAVALARECVQTAAV